MLIILFKCRQAKIIPYFQSQFCVILMSPRLILKPKVVVTVLWTTVLDSVLQQENKLVVTVNHI